MSCHHGLILSDVASYALLRLVGWKINFAMNDLSGLTSCDSVTHRFNKAQEMRHVWSEAREVQVEIKG